MSILGIHHVTAIASDPQRNLDFCTRVLGLRFVKRTVNFDDPTAYHFYFADEFGTPGSILTFFPWPGARPGRQGPGQVAVTAFAVLPASLGFWMEQFIRHNVPCDGPTTRGPRGADAERVLAFRDPDGLPLEIVGHASAESRPFWAGAPGIPPEHAIHGFHSVTIWVDDGDGTERVLVDMLGFRAVREEETTRRYAAGDGGASRLVDVRATGPARVTAPTGPRSPLRRGSIPSRRCTGTARSSATCAWHSRPSETIGGTSRCIPTRGGSARASCPRATAGRSRSHSI